MAIKRYGATDERDDLRGQPDARQIQISDVGGPTVVIHMICSVSGFKNFASERLWAIMCS